MPIELSALCLLPSCPPPTHTIAILSINIYSRQTVDTRITVLSAACAPAATTRCRKRAWMRWLPGCRNLKATSDRPASSMFQNPLLIFFWLLAGGFSFSDDERYQRCFIFLAANQVITLGDSGNSIPGAIDSVRSSIGSSMFAF